MDDLAAVSNAVLACAAAYLLHSTLLLAACWLVIRVTRAKSQFLVERLWKRAALLGIVTAAAQMALGIDFWTPPPGPLNATGRRPRLRLAEDGVQASRQAVSETLAEASATDLATDGPAAAAAAVEHASGPVVPGPDFEGRGAGPTPQDVLLTPESTTDGPRGHSLVDRVAGGESAPLPGPWTAWLRAAWPRLSSAASLLLLCSVAAGAALLAMQSWRLRDWLLRQEPLTSGPARQALNRILKRNKIRRRVRLLASSLCSEPFACGLIRWTIVLPAHTELRLGREELPALLAHEVAHLVRGDVLWLWIGRVLCACLAFQPLNFLARRRWQQAAECLCDDWAVDRGADSLSLARCLTRIAEWQLAARRRAMGLAAAGSQAAVVRRVERLVQTRRRTDVWTRPGRRRLLTLGSALAVVGLATFAPRVALPQTPVSQRVAAVGDSAAAPIDKSAADSWRALEAGLLQLERELDHASRLLESRPGDDLVASHVKRLRVRTALLRARIARIHSLLGKESSR